MGSKGFDRKRNHKKMTCKPDNEKTFTTEQPYTKKCEACSLFCKIWHYRQCTDRFAWNEDQGVDVFKEVRDQEKAAAYQMGQTASTPKKEKKPGEKTPQRHNRRRR